MSNLSERLRTLTDELALLEASKAEADARNAKLATDLAVVTAQLEECQSPPAPGPLPLRMGLITTFSSDGVHDWVPNVLWKNLEPSPGVYDFSTLDSILGEDVARIRLMTGTHAPQWAKDQGSVTVYNATDGRSGVIPCWWRQEQIDNYNLLIDELALRYDGAFPAITMSAGMTIYAEPLMRELSDARTRTNLLAEGFTVEADLDALQDGMAVHQAFRETRTVMSFNPYQRLNPNGSYDLADLDTTLGLMSDLRVILPSSIVQNNSIRTPVLGGDYPGLYSAMTGPKSFQTAGAARIGNVYETLRWAVDQGAHLIESYVGAYDALTPEQEAEIVTGLEANA